LDNQTLASGSVDWTVKIWKWKSGLLLKNLTGHTHTIFDVISLPNDQLASCGTTINIWNLKTGKLLKTLRVSGLVKTLILLHNNGLYFASAQSTAAYMADGSIEDAFISIWNIKSGHNVAKLKGHENWVQCMCTLNESHLASGSVDQKIKLWNYQNGRDVKTLSGHSSIVKALVLLCNGHLASASVDQTIRIWEIENKFKLIKVLFGHEETVNCLTVLTNGNLASGSLDKTINIWHFSPNSKYSSNSTTHCKSVFKTNLNKYLLLFHFSRLTFKWRFS
jgi:WD40 repeat protein